MIERLTLSCIYYSSKYHSVLAKCVLMSPGLKMRKIEAEDMPT